MNLILQANPEVSNDKHFYLLHLNLAKTFLPDVRVFYCRPHCRHLDLTDLHQVLAAELHKAEQATV